MRLGRIASALPVVALGLAVLRHARWVTSPENAGQDGTCAGIEEILAYALAVFLFLLALLVLLKGIPFLVRLLEGGQDVPGDGFTPEATPADGRHGPRSLHPAEDTTSLFD